MCDIISMFRNILASRESLQEGTTLHFYFLLKKPIFHAFFVFFRSWITPPVGVIMSGKIFSREEGVKIESCYTRALTIYVIVINENSNCIISRKIIGRLLNNLAFVYIFLSSVPKVFPILYNNISIYLKIKRVVITE